MTPTRCPKCGKANDLASVIDMRRGEFKTIVRIRCSEKECAKEWDVLTRDETPPERQQIEQLRANIEDIAIDLRDAVDTLEQAIERMERECG